MENLDGTVIATALPQMGKSFQVSPVDLNIGMTAYLLMLAVFIPISGWVADRIGARSVFVSAIAIFTVSSILCGLSNGIMAFTAARIIQGIGGAMMVPVGRLVVLRTTEKHNLMEAIAYITWPGLVAPVVGPPLGGFITTYATWHWIFFLNVPLGIIGLVLSVLWIPNLREDKVKPFDWIGFALSSSACVTFMYGMELVGRENATWGPTSFYLICGCVLGALAVIHFRRAVTPLLNLDLLKIKSFAITIEGGSLFRIAISVSPFLLPLMFQVGFGLNAFQSGILMLGLFVGNLGMKPATTPVLRRFGFRSVLIWNGILTAILMLGCAVLVSSNTEDHHSRGALRERPLPLDAVHVPVDARLCGHPETGAQFGHQFLQHDHTNVDGNGRGGWRHHASRGWIAGRQSPRDSDDEGISHRVSSCRRSDAPRDRRLLHPRSRSGRGGQWTPLEPCA